MNPLFHPGLYEFDKPQPSYWEATACTNGLHSEPLKGIESCAVAIIGGGYTGLAAAAQRRGARIHPHSEVLRWHKQADGSHLLETAAESLIAKQVILTGNGFMPEDKSIYFAYGYHGNGVNSATWSGRELARWLAGKDSGNSLLPKHLPAIMQGGHQNFHSLAYNDSISERA